MNDWTPNTHDVRALYAASVSMTNPDPKAERQFDRWLERHDRELMGQLVLESSDQADSLSDGTVVVDVNGRILKRKTGAKGYKGWKYLEPLNGVESHYLLDASSLALPAAVIYQPAKETL